MYGSMGQISWVSPKLVQYSERVFKPQDTVNYKLNVGIFGIHEAPRVKLLESIMGRRPKILFDKYIGLARPFSRAHRFLELALLAIKLASC